MATPDSLATVVEEPNTRGLKPRPIRERFDSAVAVIRSLPKEGEIDVVTAQIHVALCTMMVLGRG